ncbi:MAG: hypothetical protein P1U36_10290 [Legionellaceae bacterium]|nr:hypothetical protein [Legionellaceae bacterium]
MHFQQNFFRAPPSPPPRAQQQRPAFNLTPEQYEFIMLVKHRQIPELAHFIKTKPLYFFIPLDTGNNPYSPLRQLYAVHQQAAHERSSDKKIWRMLIKLVMRKPESETVDPKLGYFDQEQWLEVHHARVDRHRFLADAFATHPKDTSLEEIYKTFEDELEEENKSEEELIAALINPAKGGPKL